MYKREDGEGTDVIAIAFWSIAIIIVGIVFYFSYDTQQNNIKFVEDAVVIDGKTMDTVNNHRPVFINTPLRLVDPAKSIGPNMPENTVIQYRSLSKGGGKNEHFVEYCEGWRRAFEHGNVNAGVFRIKDFEKLGYDKLGKHVRFRPLERNGCRMESGFVQLLPETEIYTIIGYQNFNKLEPKGSQEIILYKKKYSKEEVIAQLKEEASRKYRVFYILFAFCGSILLVIIIVVALKKRKKESVFI